MMLGLEENVNPFSCLPDLPRGAFPVSAGAFTPLESAHYRGQGRAVKGVREIILTAPVGRRLQATRTRATRRLPT
jgi:hypothetical protein